MKRTITAVIAAIAAGLVVGCSHSKEPPKTHYFAFQVGDESQALLGKDVLHEVDRRGSSRDTLVVDVMIGQSLQNFYSDAERPVGIREISESLKPDPASSAVLVPDALARVSGLAQMNQGKQEVVGYIVTPGTCDPVVLARLAGEAIKLPQSASVQLLGVTPENRLCMSQVFQANQRIKISSTEEEWLRAIHNSL